ncbi:uncharacterized protein LOC115885626 [Sitophilus oryzae]|uniref:Uncharacterized protein LOC115885626 n=1 Tax=Sitophilus oryzae TaxID=7048 RepID=A0A6J2YAE7_SITOR|nr:uncharacterized protein LOC115885626 [Sitophilus oryzae]
MSQKRSIDSAIDSSGKVASAHARQSASINEGNRRWVYSVDETLRQNFLTRAPSKVSPSSDNNKSVGRGSNISILHLRSTSEPWEKNQHSNYSSAARSYFASSRSTTTANVPSSVPPLTKHQSLGSTTHKWTNSPSFHSGSEVNSPGIFTFSGSCNRELSPVRWCDREVDGVYLGKSGWVQVQQRSLDDNRRASYSINLAKSLQSNRTGIKLANYHFSSEPNKASSFSRTNSVVEPRPEPRPEPPRTETSQAETHRPAYLVLQNREYDRKIKTPSPLPESGSFSPPSVTPIISPPPAFQDKTKSPMKSRTFFGKTPFLPRSNAIEDSDNSPPASPPGLSQWKTTAPNAPILPKPKPQVIKTSPGIEKPPRASKKAPPVPQTKSLEENTASRRMQFKQKYGQSTSSSSSSSMGFRSLDSCLNRTSSVMPRLSENTDSSVDVYEDADEEDNNSSSVNMSMVNTAALQAEYSRKLSPSGRTNRLTHYRNQMRRSPAGSDTNKHSPTSSSSSSNEFLSRSPTGTIQSTVRRNVQARPHQPAKSPQDDPTQRVRRSRSLQLPERTPPPNFGAQKVSPQHPEQHRVIVKVPGAQQVPERKQYPVGVKPQSLERGEMAEEELLREAEVVTGFLYGSRSRAAAQAQLMHRYNNNNISVEEKNKESNKPILNSDLTVYYVGNNKNERQRLLVRGATSPSLPTSGHQFDGNAGITCSPENCDFWPHCAHRDSLHRDSQFVMRQSQSYPSHQRSLDSAVVVDAIRPPLTSSMVAPKPQDPYKRPIHIDGRARKPPPTDSVRRTSPARPPSTGGGGSIRRNGSADIPVFEKKSSPRASNVSGSSSGSDVWLTPSRVSSRKGSGASTPVDAFPDRIVTSRPGSAPTEEVQPGDLLVAQQRSMSLPKSFLSGGAGPVVGVNGMYLQSGDISWQRHGTDSLGSSPGLPRKIPTPEVAHTAPVTPLHEVRRGIRSPLGVIRRTKASSTPHLSDSQTATVGGGGNTRKWRKRPEEEELCLDPAGPDEDGLERDPLAPTAESVLQKFRKTFSLRFPQRKLSKDSCGSEDTASEANPSEEDSSPAHVPSAASSGGRLNADSEGQEEHTAGDQKYRFGPLIWRTSKERKKLNKAARSAKCNSGDSGIQIEIPSGGGAAGDSSESHDTDGAPFDSPPLLRRKPPGRVPRRPHSDNVGRVIADKFKFYNNLVENRSTGNALEAILDLKSIDWLVKDMAAKGALRLRDSNLWNQTNYGHSRILPVIGKIMMDRSARPEDGLYAHQT